MVELEHKCFGKLLALIGGDWFVRHRALDFILSSGSAGDPRIARPALA